MTNALEYLSRPWFEAVDLLLESSRPVSSGTHALTIEFDVGPEAEDRRWHHQVIAGGRLLQWRPGRAESGSLLVRRPLVFDLGDNLVRSGDRRIGTLSTVTFPDEPERMYSLAGLPLGRLSGPHVELHDLHFTATINTTDGPMGRSQCTVIVRNRTVEVSPGAPANASLTIEATWADCWEWFQGWRTLGSLLANGARSSGELWALSALEWCAAGYARAERVEPLRKAAHLRAFADTRSSPLYMEQIDVIDAVTA